MMRSIHAARWLVVAVGLSLVAACGGGASVTEVGGDAPVGFQRVTNSGAGFSMVVPSGWEIVDASEVDADEIVAAGASAFPELADMSDEMTAALAQGVIFWAFDFESGSADFVDNINVIKAPRQGASAEALRDLNLAQLRQVATNVTAAIETSLQGYEVVVMEYSLPAYGLIGIGALVLTSDTQWVITLVASSRNPLDFEFDTVIDLFREA